MGWEQRKEMNYRQKEHERGKYRAVGILGLVGRTCQRRSLGSDLDSLRICALFSGLVERSWRFVRVCRDQCCTFRKCLSWVRSR